MKNVILAVNYGLKQDGSPLIQLLTSNGRTIVQITDPTQIAILENFPTTDGWYLTDPMHGIPLGEKVDSNIPNARYLYRIGYEKAGLLVRGDDGVVVLCDVRRGVLLSLRPSDRFGVLGLVTNATPQQMQYAARATVEELRTINLTVPHGLAELAEAA